MAFATSLLYLLVQPRPERVVEAQTRWHARNRGRRPPPYILNWTSKFLLLSGWAIYILFEWPNQSVGFGLLMQFGLGNYQVLCVLMA